MNVSRGYNFNACGASIRIKEKCILHIVYLNAKSNLTLFITEYVYIHSDFKQIEYYNEFQKLALT